MNPVVGQEDKITLSVPMKDEWRAVVNQGRLGVPALRIPV
jgi:hypothetical protein